MKRLSVAFVGNNDIIGGASRAAFRLYKGTREIGIDCSYVVGWKHGNDPGVIEASYNQLFKPENPAVIFSSMVREQYIDSNRTSLTNTFFSFTYPGYPLSSVDALHTADIVNLHWIEHYLTPASVAQLASMNKPVVWTLHDMRPFTGGCYYTAGCENFSDRLCKECPQLLDDPFSLPNAVLKDKIRLFGKLDLTIVTPSKWLSGEAGRSALFRNCRIEAIPNSIETGLYKPRNREAAKINLGIAPDALTLLFAAVDSKEERKGFRFLKQALDIATRDPEFSRLIREGKVSIICMGIPDESINKYSIPVIQTKYLSNDEDIVGYYNASDIYLLPSTEDNLPNGVLEAVSCGVPVIAFNIGGIPDMVDHTTGRLVEARNTARLAEAIMELSMNPVLRNELGRKGRSVIESRFGLDVQAGKYAELFSDILENRSKKEKDISFARKGKIPDLPGIEKNLGKIRNRLLRYSFRKKTRDAHLNTIAGQFKTCLFVLIFSLHSRFPRLRIAEYYRSKIINT